MPTCPCCGHRFNPKKQKSKKPNDEELAEFDKFRLGYQGKKRGLETEMHNFIKHKDWRNVLPILSTINLNFDVSDKKYIPHLQTFINQRRWEMMDIKAPVTEGTNPYGQEHDWRNS